MIIIDIDLRIFLEDCVFLKICEIHVVWNSCMIRVENIESILLVAIVFNNCRNCTGRT